MITPEQKSRMKSLVSEVVSAEVRKVATSRFSPDRPAVQQRWHKAVDELDRFLDGLVKA